MQNSLERMVLFLGGVKAHGTRMCSALTSVSHQSED